MPRKHRHAGSVIHNIYHAVRGRRENAPPKVRAFLSRYGEHEIVRLQVCRKPIFSQIDKLANLLSFGKFGRNKSKLSYDKLFHLYLVFQLDNNEIYKIEKNQVVQVSTAEFNSEGSECLDIPIPVRDLQITTEKDLDIGDEDYQLINNGTQLTLNKMLGRAEQLVGKHNLYVYDPVNNNCQAFCMAMLSGSELANSEVETFVLQNVKEVLSGLGILEHIANGATNLASRVDTLVHGEGIFFTSSGKVPTGITQSFSARPATSEAMWKSYKSHQKGSGYFNPQSTQYCPDYQIVH